MRVFLCAYPSIRLNYCLPGFDCFLSVYTTMSYGLWRLGICRIRQFYLTQRSKEKETANSPLRTLSPSASPR